MPPIAGIRNLNSLDCYQGVCLLDLPSLAGRGQARLTARLGIACTIACRKGSPFDKISLQLDDDNPLPTCIECVFKRGGDFTLRHLLAFAAGDQSKGRLQHFSEDARDRRKRGRAVSHHGPFLGRDVCNIAADRLVKLNLGLSREAGGENNGGSQRARLAIDCRISLVVVSPDLGAVNATKRPKTIPKGGSIPVR
jgi:hypothetical protein